MRSVEGYDESTIALVKNTEAAQIITIPLPWVLTILASSPLPSISTVHQLTSEVTVPCKYSLSKTDIIFAPIAAMTIVRYRVIYRSVVAVVILYAFARI